MTGQTQHRKGHSITIETAAQHVEVSRNGVVLASTDSPVLLHETGLPTRYYFRPEAVRMELLEPTEKHTHCPFKGDASYWTVRAGDEELVDLVWSYPDPIPDAKQIEGLLCFYNDRVDLEIDGERVGA